MPNLLAIDSSTSTTRIALWLDGELTQYRTDEPRQAAQQLLPLIQQALDEASLDISKLDAIAATTGPGSFTGLRIGIGAAQGLSMATDTPLIGISSLALLAFGTRKNYESGLVLVALPAREQEIYFAAYDLEKDSVNLQDHERVLELTADIDDLPDYSASSLIGVGAGWQYRTQLETLLRIELNDCLVDSEASMDDLCQFALKKFNNGETVAAESLLPNYVKEQLDYRS